jgi:hypothetical protein
MSRSIHSLVSKKATNREVLFNGRLSTFVNPPTHSGDLYVSRDLYVTRDTHLKDLEVTGDLSVTGNLLVSGTVSAMQYSPGQVIKTFMYSNSDLSQTSQDISGGFTRTIFTFNYTPTSSNSYLLLEYQTIYTFGGSNGDDMFAKMYVSGGEISSTYQHWIDGPGGGSRSSAIFPIVGRYTNASTSAKAIRVDVINSTDDIVNVQSNNSTWLRITEVGR